MEEQRDQKWKNDGFTGNLERHLHKLKIMKHQQLRENMHQVPFGYKIEDNTIKFDFECASIVCLIYYDFFKDKKSFEEISESYDMYNFELMEILENPFYVGRMWKSGKLRKAKHPPIISKKFCKKYDISMKDITNNFYHTAESKSEFIKEDEEIISETKEFIPPLGYLEKGGKVVIDDTNAWKIISIFIDYYKKEKSYDVIAEDLGLPSFEVFGVLGDPFYLGKEIVNEELVDGSHPPLISEEICNTLDIKKKVLVNKVISFSNYFEELKLKVNDFSDYLHSLKLEFNRKDDYRKYYTDPTGEKEKYIFPIREKMPFSAEVELERIKIKSLLEKEDSKEN